MRLSRRGRNRARMIWLASRNGAAGGRSRVWQGNLGQGNGRGEIGNWRSRPRLNFPAARILQCHGQAARPAASSSPPIPLPQIPLPTSAMFTSGSVLRRQPNHVRPSAAAVRTPGAGRWNAPPPLASCTRCDRGPVARRFGCTVLILVHPRPSVFETPFIA